MYVFTKGGLQLNQGNLGFYGFCCPTGLAGNLLQPL